MSCNYCNFYLLTICILIRLTFSEALDVSFSLFPKKPVRKFSSKLGLCWELSKIPPHSVLISPVCYTSSKEIVGEFVKMISAEKIKIWPTRWRHSKATVLNLFYKPLPESSFSSFSSQPKLTFLFCVSISPSKHSSYLFWPWRNKNVKHKTAAGCN